MLILREQRPTLTAPLSKLGKFATQTDLLSSQNAQAVLTVFRALGLAHATAGALRVCPTTLLSLGVGGPPALVPALLPPWCCTHSPWVLWLGGHEGEQSPFLPELAVAVDGSA